MALYDRLPRWIRAMWWVICAAVVSALVTDVQTGQIAVNPVYVPFLNIALIAAKDFINTKSTEAQP